MKTASLLLVTALTWTAATSAHEPARSAPATRAATQDAPLEPVVAVADQFTAALKGADFERVRALLDPNVLILESGGAERSADEYLAHHAIADASFLGAATVKVLYRVGDIDGNTAWLTTESDITPAAGSDEKPLSSTETLVFHRSQGVWRIVHVHWSSRSKKAAEL